MNAISPTSNGNPGIVPPWLSKPPVVPPRNPGIVPPWLRDDAHILPIELPTEEYTILPVDPDREVTILPIGLDGETGYVSTPVDVPPATLADALRRL